jgi:transposase
MKFIGLDAHSGSCFYVVKNGRGRVLGHGEVLTSERTLLEMVRSIRRPRKLIFEEGVVSQWLYLLLKDEVDELVVCQPPERKGPKTDRLDAHQLADDLRQERFVRVFHSDHRFMELRALVSAHADVTQELTRTKNRYKALYRQSAIPIPVAQSFYRDDSWVEHLPTAYQRRVATSLLRQLEVLDDEKKGFEQFFAENTRNSRVAGLLKTIPGIGDIRANQLVAIIVTPARFENKYHFFAYAMLVKHKQRSGGQDYPPQRPRGQTLLKSILHSSVYGALRSDNAFRRKYEAMLQRGAHVRAARKAVARSIAATVLGVWKSGKPYDDKHREKKPQNKTCHSAVQSL